MYRSRLLQALDHGSERAVHEFLKSEPRPLCVAFARGWNKVLALSEFSFGRDYRADFLVLSAHSGAWHAAFVELESPAVRLYVRNGSESQSLKVALRQVKDWRIWLQQYNDQFRRELRDRLESEAKANPRFSPNPTNLSGDLLLDPRTAIFNHFAVVIGRRKTLSPKDEGRRGYEEDAEIATYDRLLDIAAKDDAEERSRREEKRSRASKTGVKRP